MATKRTLVHAEPDESGTVFIRFTEQEIDGAGNVIATRHHRASVEPGGRLDDVMPHVERHMDELGFTPPPAERVASLGSLIAKVHTPELVAKFRADRAKTQGGKP